MFMNPCLKRRYVLRTWEYLALSSLNIDELLLAVPCETELS